MRPGTLPAGNKPGEIIMKIKFLLTDHTGRPGPEHAVELQNPDPHPVAVNRLARKWAATQSRQWDRLMVEEEGRARREVSLV